MLKRIFATCLLVSFVAAADDIKMGGKTFDDVYVTGRSDSWIVKNPADGSVQTISKKRTDVSAPEFSANRDKLLAAWEAQQDTHEQAQAAEAPKASSAARTAETEAQAAEAEAQAAEAARAARRAKTERSRSSQGKTIVEQVYRSPEYTPQTQEPTIEKQQTLPLAVQENWKPVEDISRQAAAIVAAQMFVERCLKCPSTAKFGRNVLVSANGDQEYRAQGSVDGQSSFGAMLRMPYEAIMIHDSTGWSCKSMTVDGKRVLP